MKARHIVILSIRAITFLCVASSAIGISWKFIPTSSSSSGPAFDQYTLDHPSIITAALYLGLAASSLICCCYNQIKRYRFSLSLIVILALCRVAHITLPIASETAFHVAFFILVSIVECLLLIEIPNEYFEVPHTARLYQRSQQEREEQEEQEKEASRNIEHGQEDEYYLIDDPSLPLPLPPSPPPETSFVSAIRSRRSRSSLSQRLLERGEPEEGRGKGRAVTKVELGMVVGVFVCAVLVILMLLVDPHGQSGSQSEEGFSSSFSMKLVVIGATSFFPFVLVPLQIMKVKRAVECGAELVSCNHSHGLAFLMLIGGFTVHFIMCCAFTLVQGVSFMYNSPNVSASSVLLGIDVIISILPLGFHLFNVTKSASRTFMCDIVARTRVVSYVVVITLHAMMVAALLVGQENCCTTNDLSNAAATVATIDFLLLLSGSLSPILQLLHQTAMRQSIHNLYLHRLISLAAVVFSVAHIVLASLQKGDTNMVHVVFGILSFCLFAICGGGGVIISKFRYRLHPSLYRTLSSIHIPSTFLGMAFLFMHQYNAKKTIDNYLFFSFILSCLFCLLLFSGFIIFNPLHSAPLELAQTDWGESYIFLVAHLQKSVPPGAYFLLYSNNDSHLNFFHARPLHVFSSKNRRIAFLVEAPSDSGRNLMFSHHLAGGKPESVLLQGPFADGTVSSFMDFVRSAPVDIDVYLCGWDSAFSKVFSILEYLKEIWSFTNIKKISCLFNVIPDTSVSDRVHTHLNRLVRDWKSTIPVTIVECLNTDLRNIDTMSRQVHFSTKASTMAYFRESACSAPPSPPYHASHTSYSSHSSYSSSHSHSEHSYHQLQPSYPNGSLPLLTRARWVVMRDEQEFNNVGPLGYLGAGFRNRVLFFCGDHFQPKLFRGWKCFVEAL